MIVVTLLNTKDSMPTLGSGYLASYYLAYGTYKKDVQFRIVECSRSYDCQVVEPCLLLLLSFLEIMYST